MLVRVSVTAVRFLGSAAALPDRKFPEVECGVEDCASGEVRDCLEGSPGGYFAFPRKDSGRKLCSVSSLSIAIFRGTLNGAKISGPPHTQWIDDGENMSV